MPAPKVPSWWDKIKNSLNKIPVGGTPSPIQNTSLPAWLQPKPPATQNSVWQQVTNKLNQLGTPTGIGGGNAFVPNYVTQYNHPATYPLTPSNTPHPSTQAQGVNVTLGQPTTVGPEGTPASTYVIGPNGAPMRVNMGPLPAMESGPDIGGGYGGGGYSYKPRRRGRGYTPRPRYDYGPSQPQEEQPAWANTGLANWQIG
jgi:hypothetical protein